MLTEETAILFVMNRKYIRPFKVLLFSLNEHRSLINCPIEIFTDDEMVYKDKFVNRVSTNIHYIPGDKITAFKDVKRDGFKERQQTAFAPKYTLLKFVNFLDRGYKRHICMDADMLCIRAVNEEILSRPYDVKAMIEIGSSKYPIRDESRDKFDYDDTLRNTRQIMVTRDRFPLKSINSGFMVLEERAIGDEVFKRAIEISGNKSFGAEQPVTTEVIQSIENLRFLELPIWYNARRRVIECLGLEFFEQYKNEIRILHYTPGKPWILHTRQPDFLDHLWLEWEVRSTPWVTSVINGEVEGWKQGTKRPLADTWNV